MMLEKAKFGDKYKTRDGRMAIILNRTYDQIHQIYNGFIVATNTGDVYSSYPIDNNGLTQCWSNQRPEDLSDGSDIIDIWKDSIDENKLNEIAWHEAFETHPLHSETDSIMIHRDGFVDGYKAGYRKAIKECV